MDRRRFLKLACAGAPALASLAPTGASAAGKTPRYGMVIDLRRCVGCHSCSVSCSVENRVPVGYFRATVGEFVMDGPGAPTIATLPRLCNHCEEPACVPVCPVHATFKAENGLVLVDSAKCLGCGFCVQACPYDARYINHETGTADKCTFCVHRLEAGLLPACVENCVGGARIFGDLDDPDSLVRRTLDAHQGDVKALAPEMNTKPNVYYINLDAFLASPANVGLPMAEGAFQAGGEHA